MIVAEHEAVLFGAVFAVAVFRDSRIVAKTGEDEFVKLRDAETGNQVGPAMRGGDDESVNPSASCLIFFRKGAFSFLGQATVRSCSGTYGSEPEIASDGLRMTARLRCSPKQEPPDTSIRHLIDAVTQSRSALLTLPEKMTGSLRCQIG